MENIYISAALFKDLAQNPGWALILGSDGRWKCSTWAHYVWKLGK